MTDPSIHVRPAEGGTVLDPTTGLAIPAAGAHVRLTTQVRRYLRRGDLELVPIPKAPKKQPAKPEPGTED